MATKDIWINLPVKDVTKSKEFFTKLGFSFSTEYGNSSDCAGLLVGSKKTVIMLFLESTFKKFIGSEIADTKLGTEVLFSFGAESKEEVDAWTLGVKSTMKMLQEWSWRGKKIKCHKLKSY